MIKLFITIILLLIIPVLCFFDANVLSWVILSFVCLVIAKSYLRILLPLKGISERNQENEKNSI